MFRIPEEHIVHVGVIVTCFSAVLFGGIMVRYTVGLHEYKAEGVPPMFCDYEAKRHWMELTMYLPVWEWYTESHFNDFEYWSLNYPPLSGYHSLLLGKWARSVSESYVMPYASRGLETEDLKLFMRQTVLVSDIIFYCACVYYYLSFAKTSVDIVVHMAGFMLLALLYPGLILIDHGYFQYNSVSLGLTALAVACLYNGHNGWGTFFYVLAINHKQMALCYALPFFVYLLKKCLNARSTYLCLLMLHRISLIVVVTFFTIWCPYLTSVSSATQVLSRIFPLPRGLFEDKVGNVWCAVNIIFKLSEHFSPQELAAMSAVCTLLAALPSLYCLYQWPSFRQFVLSLISVSMAFFLFSFQVREKSILFVALPVILYAHYDMPACCWFLFVSHVSLFHLAMKDNLYGVYFAMALLFLGYLWGNPDNFVIERRQWWKWILRLAPTILTTFALHYGYILIPPPAEYPDYWPLMNALYSFAHFVGFFIYFNYQQICALLQGGHQPVLLYVLHMRQYKILPVPVPVFVGPREHQD